MLVCNRNCVTTTFKVSLLIEPMDWRSCCSGSCMCVGYFPASFCLHVREL